MLNSCPAVTLFHVWMFSFFRCTTDRNVVNDLTYGVNLDEAFVEVHAFKFADDVNVYFKCEITFCRKTATSHDEAMGETTCRGVTVILTTVYLMHPPIVASKYEFFASTPLNPKLNRLYIFRSHLFATLVLRLLVKDQR